MAWAGAVSLCVEVAGLGGGRGGQAVHGLIIRCMSLLSLPSMSAWGEWIRMDGLLISEVRMTSAERGSSRSFDRRQIVRENGTSMMKGIGDCPRSRRSDPQRV